MRALLGLTLLALIAGLVAFFGATEGRPGRSTETAVEQATPGDRSGPGSEDPGLADLPTSRVPGGTSGEESTSRVPEAAAGAQAWEILGVVLAAGDDAPLEGYTVCVLPSGTRPRGSPPGESQMLTDESGAFHAEGLDRRGPWDVYVWAYDPFDEPVWFSARARVGVARASKGGGAEPQIFRIRAGPTVVLRSQRPPEVAARDLLLEARGRISPLSSQMGGAGGYAPARPTPEGFCSARIPNVTNSVQDEGFGVRAVTLDGLWSVVELESGRLRNDTRALIDAALEPRGKVAFRVELDRPVEGSDAARAAHFVGWRLPLGDQDRDALDLPDGMRTREFNRPLVAREGGVFEVHDLPIGPVEFRTRESLRVRGDETRYEVTLPIQATAIHGDPEPVVVRIRVVR